MSSKVPKPEAGCGLEILAGSVLFWALMPLVVEIVYLVGWVQGGPLQLGMSYVVAIALFPISLPTLVVSAILTFMLRRSPGVSRAMARIGLGLMLFYLLLAIVAAACGYQPASG